MVSWLPCKDVPADENVNVVQRSYTWCCCGLRPPKLCPQHGKSREEACVGTNQSPPPSWFIMSSTSQLVSIGAEDPVFYTEFLRKTPGIANQRLPSDERLCPFSRRPRHSGHQDTLARRLQKLLDDIAAISICKKGNVSATTACLKDDKGTLETQLYIVFNHEEDEAPRRCGQHLQSIFKMLQKVPYQPLQWTAPRRPSGTT